MSAIDQLNAALDGRYVIDRELGRGGMATVYLAHDVKHDRKVALKVLREDLSASLGTERFLREVKVAAAFQHPHILPLYDSGEAGGLLFYVMPFVDGESLRERLQREVELPVQDAVRILRDVADALSEAHRHGVVHRDLKPENVMIRGRHAIVTDFGVAKALSAATKEQSLTTIGLALGTPVYMSPEQATADPHLDHRADIYAFGVLAYELLTGQPPFRGDSPQQTLAAHVTAAPKPLSAHRAAIPTVLESLVMRCLEKAPADRWQHAEELIPPLEALRTPSSGMTPHAASPDGRVKDAARPSRAARRAIVGSAAVVVVAAVAIGIARQRNHSDSTRLVASAEKPLWLAVLPAKFSGRAEDDWFGDGLADELRGALVKIPGVQVKGSQSSQSFKGSTKSIPEIARALGVDLVVVSSVRWSPTSAGVGRVYFTPELVDARNDAVRWRSPYDTTVTDLANGQRAIAEHAARDLAAAFALSAPAATTLSRATQVPRANPDAYAAYLTGRQEFLSFSPASGARSVKLLARAAELDSTFAKAHAWLAIAITYHGGDTLTSRRAAERAIALAPNDPDALTASGEQRLRRADWRGALADFSRALASDPNNVWAAYDAMQLEAAFGNSERSVKLGKDLAAIDPVSMGDAYSLALLLTGRIDEALAAARAGLAVDSMSVANGWWSDAAAALAARGDVAGVRAAVRGYNSLGFVNPAWTLALEAIALANAGRKPESRAVLDSLRLVTKNDAHGGPFRTASVFAALGEADSAFAYLDRGVAVRQGLLREDGIPGNPFLVSLHADPRWPALLKRVGLR